MRALRRLWFLFALVALCGCRVAFDVSPTAAGQLQPGQRVTTIAGGEVEVPESYAATVVLRREGPARAMYPQSGGVPVTATAVPADQVERARDSGYVDDDLTLATPVAAGITWRGTAVAYASGTAPPPFIGPPVLWARDAAERMVEIPLEHVRHVHVEAGPSTMAIVGIVAGVLAAAGAGVAVVFAVVRNAD